MDYLDLELEVSASAPGEYAVAVVSSPGGQAREELRLPYDDLALAAQLKDLQIAVLRSVARGRRILSYDEATVQTFGSDMLQALLTGTVRSCYDVSLQLAKQQRRRLRFRLRILPPELARLPWEFLYDWREGEFLGLSRAVSLVRFVELPGRTEPLAVTPPLRVLCMTAMPSDLPELNVARERERLDRALEGLQRQSLLEVVWLEGESWRRLQSATMEGPWHVFHFIGHGDFDQARDEGLIALVDERTGRSQLLTATQIARLLAGNEVRLAVLNACEGAYAGESDVFSSTAATLVRRGIPAVLAMQYAISDDAALEFSRTFYESLARGMPVDACVGEARIALSLGSTVEWATPVLHMRSPDGLLFDLAPAAAVGPPAPAPSATPPPATPPPATPPPATPPPASPPPATPPPASPPPATPPPATPAPASPPPATPAPRAASHARHRRAWDLMRDHPLPAGAGVLALLLVAALVIGEVTGVARGLVVSRTPTPVTQTSPPAYALDLKGLSNITVLGPTPGLNSAGVRSSGSSLELDFTRQSGNVLVFDVPPTLGYREDIELGVDSSSIDLYVVLNQQEHLTRYSLHLNSGSGTAQFLRLASPDGTQRPFGPAVAVPGLGSGQRLAMTIVVSPPKYSVSIGGHTLAEATDASGDRTPGKPGLAAAGNQGSVRVSRAEIRPLNT